MICGTDFVLVDFAEAWARLPAAGRARIHAEAIDEATAPNAVCLASPDGLVAIALQPRADATMRAFVLLAVGLGNRGAFQRSEPALVAIARDMGADGLAFGSKRKGWRKLLGPAWRQTGVDTFERGV